MGYAAVGFITERFHKYGIFVTEVIIWQIKALLTFLLGSSKD
jgi:hypothetical protein